MTQKKGIIYSGIILAAAGAFAKFIGAFLKIPLASIIGPEGVGYFSAGTNLYNIGYIIGVVAIPAAVANIINSGQERDHNFYYKSCVKFFITCGVIISLFMFIFSRQIAGLIGSEAAGLSVAVAAPSFLFCMVAAVIRGHYQWKLKMSVSAKSQLIGAIFKAALGLSFAVLAVTYLSGRSGSFLGVQITEESITYLAAAAAMLGVTLSSLVSALYLVLVFYTDKNRLTAPFKKEQSIYKKIAAVALPIIAVAVLTQLGGLIDLFTTIRRLSDGGAAGVTISTVAPSQTAAFLYGGYQSAKSFFNVPIIIVAAFGGSAIAVLSKMRSRGKEDEMAASITSIIKLSVCIVLPIGTGILCSSGMIINTVFGNPQMQSVSTAFALSGIASIFAGLGILQSNIIQSFNKMRVPMVIMGVAAIVKIIANIIFIRIPALNIAGAALGDIVFYMVIFVATLYYIIKFVGLKIDYISVFLKPFLAAVTCGITAFLFDSFTNSRLIGLVGVLVAGLVYLIMLFLLKIPTKNDIKLLPFSSKIEIVLDRLKLIR